MAGTPLRPAAVAFDAAAQTFDTHFGHWQSVAAQRRAVYRAVLSAFPERGHLLDVGGGTGEDAAWLLRNGFGVTLTDVSPAMVGLARAKLGLFGSKAEVVAAEDLGHFADLHFRAGGMAFDGAVSNFAPLNCVEDLVAVARGLARLIRPGGSALLVLFGTFSPGEILVETLRGRPRQAFRRLKRGPVEAQLGGQRFTVTYHCQRALCDAMFPWFEPVRRTGIGIFVPPSAAEPWITRHPRLLRTLEHMDQRVEHSLAMLGDHILYHFRRREAPSS